MNVILVPTDFSPTAKNAAQYALTLADALGVKKIVLYNAFQIPVTADPVLPIVQMIDVDELKKVSESQLQHAADELTGISNNITIETFSEMNLLADGVNDICKKVQADLVVMGITEVSKIEESLIGSNSISVAKNTSYPVIIVPEQAGYKKISKVMLACDFKKVIETTPLDAIRSIIGATKAALHVLHVNHNNEPYSPETAHEIKMLDSLLQGLQPQYHFKDGGDFMQVINDFAEEQQIDLIITIPKKHGWFDALFKKSHVKMLAYHSKTPIMVVHE